MTSNHVQTNAAILPGSVLPYVGLYQQLADSLPAGAILVVLPPTQSRSRVALERLVLQLQGAGHRVMTAVDDAGAHAGSVQPRFALGGF